MFYIVYNLFFSFNMSYRSLFFLEIETIISMDLLWFNNSPIYEQLPIFLNNKNDVGFMNPS